MRVAVLGAGLQGACVAMELASAGVAVDLYDRDDRCVARASAQNEGKIHLGYVYANDPTLSTARTMVRGALAFAPLLRRWLGRGVDALPVSTPFYYAVHETSLLGIAEVEHHLRRAHAIALEEGRGERPDYFGADYREAPSRLSERECGALFDRRTTRAAFRTPEVSIDPEALASLVRERLAADAKIRCVLRSRVLGVEPDDRGVAITFEQEGGRERARYDHVVNTLWEGRLAVDRTAGLMPKRPWLYRVKYYLRLRAPGVAAALPSATIVLGPFGDTVAYGADELYLSWYPAGLRGLCSEVSPPDWPFALDEATAAGVRRAIMDGLVSIVPSVSLLTPDAVASCEVKGGVIFAWGRTDIDDRASALHERHAIGPQSFGRYHTVDTGKLTMAPLFGKLVADRITQAG
jgi:glycine/D-amino acid oxidase-like deaminating enzyme